MKEAEEKISLCAARHPRKGDARFEEVEAVAEAAAESFFKRQNFSEHCDWFKLNRSECNKQFFTESLILAQNERWRRG